MKSLKFHHYRDRRGEWRWRIQAMNNRIIADSAEGYKTRSGVIRAGQRFRSLVATKGFVWMVYV